MKKSVAVLAALVLAVSFSACGLIKTIAGNTSGQSAETGGYSLPDETLTFDTEGISSDFTVRTEDGKYTQSGNVYTLTEAGTYVLSGTLENGQIIVKAGDEDEVEIDFDGVIISCSSDSPVYFMSAGEAKVKALEGTTNIIRDERALKSNDSDETGSAAVYSTCDLHITGKGRLSVSSSYNNGIHTKDDLKIKNVTLQVTAPNNALKGNDSVTIESGDIVVISTAGDGIKTSNSDISGKGNQRGTVKISGGSVRIYSGADGIDASYNVDISGADTTVAVFTHSYSRYSDSGVLKTSSSGGVKKSADSAKGIKADNGITVSGGIIEIKTMDDGVHANGGAKLENGSAGAGNITVSGGKIIVTAADDGIHADGTVHITDGYIEVVDSHEGIEGNDITFDGGETHIYATDDGVNATSSGQRNSDGLITVNGGKVFVEVGGRDVDGIDSNGSYRQTGGFVLVSNPNADSSGNMSAVDVDATVTVTGGVIIALGTVPGQGGAGGPGGWDGPGGWGGRGGGRFGMGGMGGFSTLPDGYVSFSGSLSAGQHFFSFGSTSETFSLKSKVTGGWIWAQGISESNYSLK